jgi:uncharacterized protein YqgV (UPF0045/DUF77 family)
MEPKERKISITAAGATGRIIIDGTDISEYVTEAILVIKSGELPQLSVELDPLALHVEATAQILATVRELIP